MEPIGSTGRQNLAGSLTGRFLGAAGYPHR
jgi:hypothetical protein